MRHLIDYYGESSESEPTSNLTFQGLKQYWIKVKKEVSGQEYQWSMKDQALLSRLMKQYPTSCIAPMMENFNESRIDGTFGEFFKNSVACYTRMKDINSGYGWD